MSKSALDTDLIADEEITERELDEFRHTHFVERLRAIIKDTHTPGRIALFAAWGSGKTSIARLLEPLVKNDGHEFVYFDAFKYAREPLLREFILRVAAETKGDAEAEKRRTELYEAQSNVRFRSDLDKRLGDVAHAFKEFAERFTSWLVLAAVVIVFILAVVIDREIVEVAALASIGLAVVFAMLALAQATGMLGLIGDSLRLTVSRERPDSPEQFERVARDLIEGTLEIRGEKKRLVVFVDELDRVDASEVIETLETLKTFLDLPGCVFVVAADRRVIEKAIALQARQETPLVRTNPYYSSASAYIDKIFQYQLELPEVLPGRLSNFARDLANRHGGVWQILRDHSPGRLDDVVSLLIPIHVSNPRRVKVLMNAYVQAYHLAEARFKSEYLSTPAIDRATEIAKLVVVRSEFPAFAEELLDDPDLTTDIPIWVESKNQDGDDSRDDTDEPAEGDELPVNQERANEIEKALNRHISVIISRDEEQAELAALVEPARERLISYLEQTSIVSGPREDLLRLESLGSPYGLSDKSATDLRNAAYGNDRDQAREILDGLDDQQQLGAVRLLASLLRQGIGFDADNALIVLLSVAESPSISLDRVAHEIAPAIRAHLGHRGIPGPRYLGGVLRVGVAAADESLIREAIHHEEALANASLRRMALGFPEQLLPGEVDPLSSFLAVEQVADPQWSAEAVALLANDDAGAVVQGAALKLARVIEGEDIPGLTAAVAELGEDVVVPNVAVFIRALEPRSLQEEAAMALAEAADGAAQAQLTNVTEGFAAISDDDLGVSVLRTTAGVPYSEQARRLAVLVRSELSDSARMRYAPRLAEEHWKAMRSGTDAELVDRTHQSLVTLIGEVEVEFPGELVAAINERLAVALDSRAALDELRRDQGNALRMAELGVLSAESVYDHALRAVLNAIGTPIQNSVVRSDLSEAATDYASELLSDASTAAVRSLFDQANHLLHAEQRVGLWLRAAAQLRERSEDVGPPVSREEVVAAAAGREDDELETLWIANFETEASAAKDLLGPWSGTTPPRSLGRGVERFLARTGIPPGQLIRATLAGLEDWPSVSFLRCLGAGRLVGDTLLELVNEVSGQMDTAALGARGLDIWDAARPSDDDRRRLILEYFLPLAAESGAAFDVAIKRCADLCTNPPRGTHGPLKDKLLAAAKQGSDAERKRRAKKAAGALIAIGLMEPPKRGVGNWVRERLRL